MTGVRGSFEALITPGAKKAFMDDYKELPAFYPQLYNIDTSGRAFEDDLVLTGLPIAVKKAEGEDIAFDRPHFRGKVRYVHAGFGLGYEVTREMVEDNLYPVVTTQGSISLSRSMREAEEVVAWGVINNAFSSTQAYDGVSLINTAHVGVGSLTLSNRPAVDEDFSVTATQSLFERFMTLKNDRGLRVSMMPSNLWVPPQNWWLAREVLESGQLPYTADNTKNVIAGELRPQWVPYLTDEDSWVATVPKSQLRIKFYWRRKPDPVSGFEKRPQIAWFGITARFSAGATDWRGIDGSPGA